MIGHLPVIWFRRVFGEASNAKIDNRLVVAVVEVSLEMLVVVDVGTKVEVDVEPDTRGTTVVKCRVEVAF